MAKVEASIVIRRAPEDVFAFVMTPANAPRYDPAVVRWEPLDDGPIRVGMRFRLVARFLLGMPSSVTSEVTEWRENRRAVFTAVSGPVRARGVHTFEPVSEGMRYTWAMEWDRPPGLLGGPLSLFTLLAFRGKVQLPLENVERLIETPGQTP